MSVFVEPQRPPTCAEAAPDANAPSLLEAQHKLAAFEADLAPLCEDEIKALLQELALMTVPRPNDTRDRNAVVKLYAAKLTRYPGKFVRRTIEDYPRMYFPSFAELVDRLTSLPGYQKTFERRRALKAKLEAASR